MALLVLVVFVVIFAMAGLVYYRFCRDTAESLISVMAEDEKIKKEGGDNWPSGKITPDDIISGHCLTDKEKEKRMLTLMKQE